MTQQAAINEIGRLSRIIVDLNADKNALHTDVIGQRVVIEMTLAKLGAGNTEGAIETLRGALAYRTAQREPRKGKA